MTGDHRGRTARRATLLVTTADEILGTHTEQIAEMNAQASSLTASGDAEWISDDVQALLGRPARSFEQFAADYAAAFS